MKYTYANLFHYFKKYLTPYRDIFVLGSFLRFVSALLWLYSSYAFASIITFVSKYQQGVSLSPLYMILSFWAASFIVRFILIYYSKILNINIGERAGMDAELGALDHLSRIDIAWHEKENAGNRIKRIQRGGSGISKLVTVWTVNIIEIVVNAIGTFIILLHFDTTLAVFMVIYQITYFSISTAFRRKTVAYTKKVNIKDEEATGVMFEMANNIRSVKVLGMANPLIGYIQQIYSELMVLVRKNMFWFHGQILARTSWEGIVRVLLLLYVIIGITKGHYELGFLILFNGYFMQISNSTDSLASVAQDVAIAKTDIGRMAELFNEPITIEMEEGKGPFPTEWDGIHIKNLSFTYGHSAVLSNISLDIKKGERVGIVGLSGAGKSTLFKLLLKEYEGNENDILIGTTPLRNIKKTEYVKRVAAVLQETEVFNMSLRNNITFANYESANNEDLLKKSTKISHVDDFLHKLPNGVESLIGEKGVKLSGGERQRLGIARAVFKEPEILFMDEATSHLDVESEQKIQDSLQHFFKDVTAVVIAHRLSTIKEMDRIVVIEDGKILEQGSFDELHASDGRFREFWDKQKM